MPGPNSAHLGGSTTSIPSPRTTSSSDGMRADPVSTLDVPFQHASPRILKATKRSAPAENTWNASGSGGKSVQRSSSARPSSPASPLETDEET